MATIQNIHTHIKSGKSTYYRFDQLAGRKKPLYAGEKITRIYGGDTSQELKPNKMVESEIPNH